MGPGHVEGKDILPTLVMMLPASPLPTRRTYLYPAFMGGLDEQAPGVGQVRGMLVMHILKVLPSDLGKLSEDT